MSMNQELALAAPAPTQVTQPPQKNGQVVEAHQSPGLGLVLEQARKRIAPLWPLESFVAVNPFLGLSSQRFEEACQTLKRVTGAGMLMPREHYQTWISEGRITAADLEEALSLAQSVAGAPSDIEALKAAIDATPTYQDSVFRTVADVCDQTLGDESKQRVVEDVSKWCAAYWDDGQSAWRMPWRHLSALSGVADGDRD